MSRGPRSRIAKPIDTKDVMQSLTLLLPESFVNALRAESKIRTMSIADIMAEALCSRVFQVNPEAHTTKPQRVAAAGSAMLKPQFSPIVTPTETDIAEFRGYFLGEGCITWAHANRSKRHLVAEITTRADSVETLRWVAARFGGSVHVYERANENPVAVWRLSARNDLRHLLTLLSGGGSIPGGKRREIELALQAIGMLDSGFAPSSTFLDCVINAMSVAKGYSQLPGLPPAKRKRKIKGRPRDRSS